MPPTGGPDSEYEKRSASRSDDYFNASRARVIGSITAAVVAVGALGGFAGLAFGSEPMYQQGPTGPKPGEGQSRSLVSAPTRGDAGNLAPAASAPDHYEALANGVEFFVPDGWNIDAQGGVEAYLRDGEGSFSYILSGDVDPSVPATTVLASNLDVLLPPEGYTQRQIVEEVRNWGDGEPFGTVVSSALMTYTALWVDTQGSAPIAGSIFLGVRSDGKVLVTLIEHIPPEEWDAAFEQAFRIAYNSFSRFAGLS
jgi:hypothetical protein